MFDINDIINNVITAAVTEATTGLLMRINALEDTCQRQHEAMTAMRDRITALETKLTEAKLFERTTDVTIPVDKDALINHLNEQEWFWEKVQNRIEAATEAKMDYHLECYDHDNYDDIASKVDDLPDLDDYVTRDEVRSEVEDVLNNCSLSIRC